MVFEDERNLSKISHDEPKSSKGFRMFPKVFYDDLTFFVLFFAVVVVVVLFFVFVFSHLPTNKVFPRLPLHNSFIALLGSFQRFSS